MQESKSIISFNIREVESIPCDLRGQTLSFGAEGRMVSEPLKTPWPMEWVTEEITKYTDGTYQLPEEDVFRIYNPEEPDQYVLVEVTL